VPPGDRPGPQLLHFLEVEAGPLYVVHPTRPAPLPEMFSTLCAGMGNAFNVLSLDVVPHIPHTLAVGFATNLAGVLPLSYFFNHGVDCFVKLIISYVGLYKRFCRDQGIL